MTETDPRPHGSPSTTALLAAWNEGDRAALEALLPRIYDELRRRASAQLRRERPGHTLETGALVHEVYLRLSRQERAAWKSREHFLAVSSGLMRRILVDHARHHGSEKRGGGEKALSLDDTPWVSAPAAVALARDPLLQSLDEGLHRLGEADPALVQVVEMRFFGGLDNEEIAGVLGVSARTVIRRWRLAQAWLYRFLQGEEAP